MEFTTDGHGWTRICKSQGDAAQKMKMEPAGVSPNFNVILFEIAPCSAKFEASRIKL
jgi:hypothetical protein